MYTSKTLALDCIYKQKGYANYAQHCATRGFEAMTERDYIELSKSCDL